MGGIALTLGALALPPVQAWLVRYAVRSQMGGEVDFNTVRVGPTGATARELRLRLPNFAVEARALRLAVSPWQLLTRQRLAIDAVEASDLQVTALSTDEPSTPFTGVLADLKAPLDWAVAQADAEGRFIIEQPGAAPLVATFRVRGREFSADKSAPIDVAFSVPGDVVPGWTGRWQFVGQLAYTPGSAGALGGLTLTGKLTPADHADYTALPLAVSVTLQATPDGERYRATLASADAAHPQVETIVEAHFVRASGEIRGDWSFATAPTLIAHLLRRQSLPEAAFAGRGTFVERTRDGTLDAQGEITFRGEHWGRVTDELAHLGAAEGTNTFRVSRRGERWQLDAFDATLTVAGSDALVRFRSLESQPLVPFRAGEMPWAELEVQRIPLAWAKPFLPALQIEGGAISGAWHARTPRSTELTLTPLRAFSTGNFSVSHPALPATQPLALTLSPVLRLTPDSAQLALHELRFAFERGDFVALNLASTIDFARLSAEVELDWTAELPSLLAGPEQPLPFAFSGRVTASADEHRATLSQVRAEARLGARDLPVFAAELLEPATFHFAAARIEAGNGFAKLAVNSLPLEWLSRFSDGYALSGTLSEGEAVLDFDGKHFALRTPLPWALTGIAVADKTDTWLRDATFELTPRLSVPWPLAATPDFQADVAGRAVLPEAASIADAAGPMTADVRIAGGRIGGVFRLDAADLDVRRATGDRLFTLVTERAMAFPAQAPAGAELPLWFKAQSGRVPLPMFRGYLSEGQEVEGEIEPTEFVAHADWPNATLKATAPVAIALTRFAQKGVTLLENVRFTCEPGAQNAAIVHAAYVENVRGMPAGAAELGSLGSGYIMYFGDNYQMPIALTYQTQIDLRQWQQQPLADAFSLPATGLITAGYGHDIYNDQKPHFHFALEHVVGADGQPVAPLRATATILSDAILAKNEVGMRFEVELATQPRVSKVAFDATLSNADNTVNVNSVLKGDFIDVAEIERLISTTDRSRAASAAAVPVAVAASPATESPAPTEPEEPRALEYPFWLVLRGRFDLELGELARDHYVIHDVRGALTLDADALAVTNLSGRTFDGAWGGDLRIDFSKTEVASPYRARGGFRVQDLDAGRIVAAVYPEEASLFTGRLSLDTEVTSQGAHLFGLMNNSAARFDFRADGGRLRVTVPHAELASTALVFGGAVTFSPEIRALGRLIRTFSDLPVEKLHARGHRDPDGLVSLDEFRVHTPQLRLSATGTWPLKNNADWLTTPFELPVQIEARDEIGVILKGMRLLEKRPGPDGFFRLTRTPKLKGTPGAPDTSEIFDLLAHAADKSSGTFGFLMRKLQKEVQKAQAKAR